jgi:Zn-dependent M28 family amino/carboxypeptidase
VILLLTCVARVAGMSGVALTVVQFLATVTLIVYVALMLDIALSPAAEGEADNASGVGVVLSLAARLTDLNNFGVHVVFPGAQKAMAQGMRAFLQSHRKQFAPGETVVINIDGVGGGDLRETKKEGPLLSVRSHSQLTGNELDADPFSNREPSDGYAAASAGLPSVTFAGTTDRLEENNLAKIEEACVELIGEVDEGLS